MITVACVLKSGEFKGRNYDTRYVTRLKSMVWRNIGQAFRFVCLTDLPSIDGIETIPLKHNWPGWWSKIELFAHDFGRTLYLDLDTIITGSLDPIAEFPHEMGIMPASDIFMGLPPKDRDGYVNLYQSSCMVWSPPAGRAIYDLFEPSVMARLKGDQDWIGELLPHIKMFPPAWFRKLKQCPEGPPPGAKIVLSMPWKNLEAAQRFPWVREIWK